MRQADNLAIKARPADISVGFDENLPCIVV